MSNEHAFAKLLSATTHDHIERDATQWRQTFLNFGRERKGHERRPWSLHLKVELFGEAVAKVSCSERRDRQAPAGNDERFTCHRPVCRLQKKFVFSRPCDAHNI